jgi:threonine dehydrogenase-like Zn-dependent dehydrogenase
MRALEWRGPWELRLVELPEPTAEPGQIVVEIANCGICGSDLHSYTRGLAAKPGQILGHEFCGTVSSAPDVPGVGEGDRVVVRPLIPCGKCDPCLAGELQLCEVAPVSSRSRCRFARSGSRLRVRATSSSS